VTLWVHLLHRLFHATSISYVVFKNELADFNKAVEYDTLNVDAYFNRGLVKAKLNDIREALKDFNRAVELNPGKAIIIRKGELQNLYLEIRTDFAWILVEVLT
jgi:tetratricopeptide (TPR) repeat protein